jgi:peptide deformylase
MKIIKYPNTILRHKAQRIDEIDNEIKRCADDMIERMYLDEGVGLAAPQVGISKQIFVMDIGQGPKIFYNPEIIQKGDEVETVEEGCLSIPGVRIDVTRPSRIIIRGLNEQGEQEEVEAEGILARVIQHEMDHLNGVLIIDHASSLQRTLLKSKLKKLEKQNEA